MTEHLLPVGTPVDLTNCEREPIHIPGSIQPHGVLMTVADPEGPVLQVSGNCFEALVVEPEEVLGRPLRDLMEAESARLLVEAMQDSPADRKNAALAPLRLTAGAAQSFDALVHRVGEVWCIELERTQGPPAMGQTFHEVRDVMAELTRAETTVDLMDTVVRHVRRLTGFDRVMLYRFDQEWNGEVVSEDKREDLEAFRGLHYPASDIPPQARALYTVSWLRFIRDIDAVNAPLVPQLNPVDGQPLDLSLAALRSVSPIHCEYLRNMGVTASMSISLLIEGELAGLIACHHYSGPYVPGAVTRATCEFLAQSTSLMLAARERDDRLARSAEISEAITAVTAGTRESEQDLAAALEPYSNTLLRMVGATGMAWNLDGRTHTAGVVPDAGDIHRLRAWARESCPDSGVFACDRVALEEASFAPLAAISGGVLLVQVAEDQDVIFFRPEAVQTVDWGGNPNLKVLRVDEDGVSRLSPRGSFALWRETVRLRSLPWDDAELEAAATLRSHLMQLLYRRNRAMAGVAETLQRSLLPDRLPVLAGWSLSADYRPASVAVGGDWYDVVELPDGRVLLVVGDVAGHGLVAAGAMAQMRNAMRAYAIEDPDPGSVLTRLDRLVSLLTPDAMATAVVVLLDVARGEVLVGVAGHPAPLICRGPAPFDLLEVTGGPPLGTALLGPVGDRVSTRAVLDSGDAMLLVSDGLFERRGEAIDISLQWLATSARMALDDDLDAPEAMSWLMRQAHPGPHEDDATLVILRRD